MQQLLGRYPFPEPRVRPRPRRHVAETSRMREIRRSESSRRSPAVARRRHRRHHYPGSQRRISLPRYVRVGPRSESWLIPLVHGTPILYAVTMAEGRVTRAGDLEHDRCREIAAELSVIRLDGGSVFHAVLPEIRSAMDVESMLVFAPALRVEG